MSKHEVIISHSLAELSERGMTLEVYNEESRLGQLTILKDGLEYYGNTWGKRAEMTWAEFEQIAKNWIDTKENS